MKKLKISCFHHFQNMEMDNIGNRTFGRILKIYLSHNRSFLPSLIPYLKEEILQKVIPKKVKIYSK